MNRDNASGYRMPPKAIADLVDAPLTPGIKLDPHRRWIALQGVPGLPPIRELARPELKLAGLRIDPVANTRSRLSYYTDLTIKSIEDGSERHVSGLPEDAGLGAAQWSPDGSQIAFTVTTQTDRTLWVADVASAQARRLGDFALNGVFGAGFCWMPDSAGLAVLRIPNDRGNPPDRSPVPDGPVIQENLGNVAPARTYQDLLADEDDASLFEYHGRTDVGIVDLDGRVTCQGASGLICRADPSPDGRYLYLETLHRPFSYTVPFYRFPVRMEVWRSDGGLVRELADLPLAEEVPIARDAVPEGPRSVGWRSDAPATLAWAEALDGGDPDSEADRRDRIFSGIRWGDDRLALVYERWWKTRWTRTWRISPGKPGSSTDDAADPLLVFDRTWEDRYGDPGSPMMRRTPAGTHVLMRDDTGHLYLAGSGASPDGEFPFVDRFCVETGESDRLWQCQAPFYEVPFDFSDRSASGLLTLRESQTEPPNVFTVSFDGAPDRQITRFPHPYPQLAGVQKELVKYERDDGVQLTGTLYLPAGHSPEDGPLPTLMWAYPREFKSASAAGQVKESPHRFVRVSSGSPLFWLLEGYAVLDGPTMPIVGEGDAEANDTYVEQLTASARAAVDELVRRGVADPDRVAVGGHSYGGFMTANLLAHTELFAAGIARSGAYNRTLTPFGFQAEERTLWQAPDVYMTMSPYAHAHKIRAPLLLIHGEADNNAGTFPMQSERLYNALKGHGATVRLVMLPLESHGYRGRESVMHTLWEMTEWLNRHVKGKPDRPGD